jgi:hypothetical protein
MNFDKWINLDTTIHGFEAHQAGISTKYGQGQCTLQHKTNV